jgi:class 3 adenylate cyclase
MTAALAILTHAMPHLPAGTVTFVFSDIEGSTALLKRLGDERYAGVLAVHRRLVRETFAAHEGHEIDTQGDAFFYSFPRARAAVAAAAAIQRAHRSEAWSEGAAVRVRLGLHTGEPAVGEEGYTGLDVVRASRIAAVGSGGQVLLSETTRAIVAGDLPDGVELRWVGEVRLKDIERPEPLHELIIDGVVVGATAPAVPASAPPAEVPAETVIPGVAEALEQMPSWLRAPARRLVPRAVPPRSEIEQRVLAEIERAMRSRTVEGAGRRRRDRTRDGRPPREEPGRRARRASSVADEIAKLQELRAAGALTDEQYAKAVDRVLGQSD